MYRNCPTYDRTRLPTNLPRTCQDNQLRQHICLRTLLARVHSRRGVDPYDYSMSRTVRVLVQERAFSNNN